MAVKGVRRSVASIITILLVYILSRKLLGHQLSISDLKLVATSAVIAALVTKWTHGPAFTNILGRFGL